MKNMLLFALNASFAHQALGAKSLAAYVNFSAGTELCEVLECNINDPGDEVLYKLHQSAKDKKIVGFSCYVWNIEKMQRLARELKKLLPGLYIVFGGPEVSFYEKAEFLALYPFVDLLIQGEGEKELAALAEVPHFGGDWPYAPGAFEALYKNAGDYHTVYYESSRGCPFGCSYCISGISGGKVREKNVDRVLCELKMIEEKYYGQKNSKIDIIKFCDRSFNFDIKRANEIYSRLIERAKIYQKTYKLLPYQFEIYPTLFDEDSFEILSLAPKGLFKFEIGIQSTNKKTLEAIGRKNFDISAALENIARIKSLGNIYVHADLIAGLPHEDLESFASGLDLLYRSANPDFIQIGFLKLLSGTKIRAEADLHGYIYENDPPYAVLANDCMSFSDIAFLRDIEKIYKRYALGTYKNALAAVCGQGGLYETLGALAWHWRENDFFSRPISQRDAFFSFYKTFENQKNIDSNVLAGLLEGDFFAHEGKKLKLRP